MANRGIFLYSDVNTSGSIYGGSFEKGSQQSFQVPEQGAELITLTQSVTTSTNIRNDPSGLEIKQATKADVIKSVESEEVRIF